MKVLIANHISRYKPYLKSTVCDRNSYHYLHSCVLLAKRKQKYERTTHSHMFLNNYPTKQPITTTKFWKDKYKTTIYYLVNSQLVMYFSVL